MLIIDADHDNHYKFDNDDHNDDYDQMTQDLPFMESPPPETIVPTLVKTVNTVRPSVVCPKIGLSKIKMAIMGSSTTL